VPLDLFAHTTHFEEPAQIADTWEILSVPAAESLQKPQRIPFLFMQAA